MTWRIIPGDCIEAMRGMDEASVDAVVCDPPYHLTFMGRSWDHAPTPSESQQQHYAWATEALRVLKPGGHLLAFGGTRTYHRLACAIEDAGFEIRDCLAYLYGSGFPKSLNLDRLRGETFCDCDDAEPTPEHDLPRLRGEHVSEAVPTESGEGALLLAGVSKSCAPSDRTMPEQGPADGAEPGLEGRRHAQAGEGELPGSPARPSAGVGEGDGEGGRVHTRASVGDGADRGAAPHANGSGASPGPRSGEQRSGEPGTLADERLAQDGRGWSDCGRCGLPRIPRGLGTALKPAHEPIVLARKPLTGTVAGNVLAHGTGALNVDGCRVGSEGGTRKGSFPNEPSVTAYGDGLNGACEIEDIGAGRWPANVILDPEAAALLDEQSGTLTSGANPTRRGADGERTAYGDFGGQDDANPQRGIDTGGASRFFYTAKASRAERNAGLEGFEERVTRGNYGDGIQDARPHTREGYVYEAKVRNSHPTVKPIALMRWLCRLVTPPGGTILDPFTGSGTTGAAAVMEGFDFIGCEREDEYVRIAEARIAFWAKYAGAEVEAVLRSDDHELRDQGQLDLLGDAA